MSDQYDKNENAIDDKNESAERNLIICRRDLELANERNAELAAQVEKMCDPEALARRFHETYERLAPSHGYETRKDSAVPWENVPEKNKSLMIAVCRELTQSLTPSDALKDYVKRDDARKEILQPSFCGVPGHFRFQQNGSSCLMCQREVNLIWRATDKLRDELEQTKADAAASEMLFTQVCRERDQLRAELEKYTTASRDKTDWCPCCEQGWGLAESEQKTRAELEKAKDRLDKRDRTGQECERLREELEKTKKERDALQVCFSEASQLAGPAFVAHEELRKLRAVSGLEGTRRWEIIRELWFLRHVVTLLIVVFSGALFVRNLLTRTR